MSPGEYEQMLAESEVRAECIEHLQGVQKNMMRLIRLIHGNKLYLDEKDMIVDVYKKVIRILQPLYDDLLERNGHKE